MRIIVQNMQNFPVNFLQLISMKIHVVFIAEYTHNL